MTHDDAVDRRPGVHALAGRDRLLAWLVTGPLGRLVAFVWDFGAAVLRGAAARLPRR